MNRYSLPGKLAFIMAILALGGIASGVVSAASTAPASLDAKNSVTVTITDLRNKKGVVRACMTTNAGKFPKCATDPASYHMVVNASGKMTLTFAGVKPGRYAIALLHDENGNGKADRAMMMMPTEGFGFSRDAKVKMGPPKFTDAAFDVGAGGAIQTIRMRYLL